MLQADRTLALFKHPPDFLSSHILNAFNEGSGVMYFGDVVGSLAEKNIAYLKEFIVLEVYQLIFGGLFFL
jgi:hypothetical protein